MDKLGTGAIPKTTTSMVKFVRTGEGLLVLAFNIALLVVPIISSSLTPAQAVKWAAVINGVAVVARTGLKMTSLVQGGGAAAPAAASTDAAHADDLVSDSDEFASLPSVANINGNMQEPLVSDADEFTSVPSTVVPANAAGNGHTNLVG